MTTARKADARTAADLQRMEAQARRIEAKYLAARMEAMSLRLIVWAYDHAGDERTVQIAYAMDDLAKGVRRKWLGDEAA